MATSAPSRGAGSRPPLGGTSFHPWGTGKRPAGRGQGFAYPFCRTRAWGNLAARAHFSHPMARNGNYRAGRAARRTWPVPSPFPTTPGSSPRETCALLRTQPSPDCWEILRATGLHPAQLPDPSWEADSPGLGPTERLGQEGGESDRESGPWGVTLGALSLSSPRRNNCGVLGWPLNRFWHLLADGLLNILGGDTGCSACGIVPGAVTSTGSHCTARRFADDDTIWKDTVQRLGCKVYRNNVSPVPRFEFLSQIDGALNWLVCMPSVLSGKEEKA